MVSPGGRTGSTTVLDMVNAHPAFGLAGENGGQLLTAMGLYKTAANQNSHIESWGRGDVHPYDLLCDLAGWFEHVTPPAHAAAQVTRSVGTSSGSAGSEPARTVRGFKEIRWGEAGPFALMFLNALFPCHRLVFSERTGDWESQFNNGDTSAVVVDHWRAYAKQQPAWHKLLVVQTQARWFRYARRASMVCSSGLASRSWAAISNALRQQDNTFKGSGNLIDASKCQLRLNN